MDLGLQGRRAIVCASSRGLGRACATSLARAGCSVVVNGVDAERIKRTAEEIAKETEAEITPVAADISTHEGQAAVLEACPDPDILINNNAGPPRKDFRELNRENMIQGAVMNMITPIEMIQKVIDPMTERQFGRIVNITSASVKTPIEGLDLSSGARAGLTAFLAGVCRQVADQNVTINNILPGMFDTDRLRGGFAPMAKLLGTTPEEVEASRREQIPARRFGDPEEFGEACAFLCSAQAGYITGQNLLIDGGNFRGVW